MKVIGISCVLVLLLAAAPAGASVLIPQSELTAWSSGQYSGYGASNTLDGDRNTIYAADNSATPYLRYDLGAVYSVDKITIINRTTDAHDRPKDYRLWVTNTLTTGDISGWTDPTVDDTFADTADLQEVTFAATSGQYVYLLLDGTPYTYSVNYTKGTVGEFNAYEVPEPASALLLLTGGVLAICRRRKK